MNANAKRRAASRQPEAAAEVLPPKAVRAPLVAATGPQAFEVDAAGAGERLDRFLGQAAAGRRLALSRTRIRALIEAGEVWVDGAAALDPAARLAEGQGIRFEAPPPTEAPLRGETLPLAIVFEDEH